MNNNIRSNSKKARVLTEIFYQCERDNQYVFDNHTVKDICHKHRLSNPFDATKLDNTSLFPKIMIDRDYFIVHLGKGRHQFVRGIKNGYHQFEHISSTDTQNWPYKKSLLNEYDMSESNILSLAYNQGIIHDFLYADRRANPNIYNSRRTKSSLEYYIQDTPIKTEKLQMEIDLTAEYNGQITTFEGKNKFPKDFAVYQLFHPYLYFCILKRDNALNIKSINCCYLIRSKSSRQQMSIIRVYLYAFTKYNDLSSISIIKVKQYNLIGH